MDSASHTTEASDLPAQGPIQNHLIALQQNLEQSLVDREQHFKQLAAEIEARAKAAAEKVASGAAELRKVLGVEDVTPAGTHFGRNLTGNMDDMQREGLVDDGFTPQNPLEQSVQHHSTHQGRVTGVVRDEQSRRHGRSRDGSPTNHVRRTRLGRDRSMDRTRRGRHSHQERRRSRSRGRSSRRSRSRERRSCVGRRSRSRSREKQSRVGRRGRSRSRGRRSRVEEGRRRSKDRSPHHENGRNSDVSRSSRNEREISIRERSLSSSRSRSPRYDNNDNPVSSNKNDPWKESRQLHEGKHQTCHTGWMKWPSLPEDGTT
ncbi:unnamed protein product [Linum trigynum]|uniref:Uncharacterized protein n=1 Tax=Linum trigynum TaxID=586398 RepID=A0AAV2FVY0_9ROSI